MLSLKMTNNIKAILTAIDADPVMIRLAGGMTIPVIGNQYQPHKDFFYPFPPALLPIFEDNGGPVLRGLLRHWFVQRSTVYVAFHLETGTFAEVGRNAQQVIAEMMLQMNNLKEGFTPEIIAFANELGFDDLPAIDFFAEEYGDLSSEFHRMEIFAQDLPLAYAPDLSAYRGDYPASDWLLNKPQLFNACAFEVPAQYTREPDWPEWLIRNADKKALFERFFAEKQPGKAWLTLNSRGWKIADAITALQQLQREEQDPLFHLISENWIKGWHDAGKTQEMY